jgi:hypothetical protein
MKKLLMAAAAVAMPVGILASTAGIAAAVTKTDVTHNTITCSTVTGKAKFAPALVLGGAQPENTSIKITLGGCTTDAAGVTISAGSGSGVLHSATNNATALLGPTAVTGSIKIKWTSNVALTNKDSTVTVTVITGGIPGDGYASLAVTAGHASVAGDFGGSDLGATSTLYSETTQTIATLTTEATPPAKGIKSINLGTDVTHTTPNSLHLG